MTHVGSKKAAVPAGEPWPFDVPAVAQVMADGLELEAPVTFLVGENGSGKSTLVESIAEAYGADVRGGHIGRRYAVNQGRGPLGDVLQLRYASGDARRKPKGFFLRAETAYGVFDHMMGSPVPVPAYGEVNLMEVSHGESFLEVFGAGFKGPGLFLLDEPEAALSFRSCLSLMAVLDELRSTGGQVICATHSPVLAALPGAVILQLSDAGIERRAWDELELVDHWRRFLAKPDQYLRHLL